ncbi:MAG: amino acid ABC transporter substrate-binding protein [Thermodesulfobacteriota bacterium]|nr:amino acid ABC transporter substrate-binding protein [Thermodesulfobacteriota bacterium]
MWRIFIKGVFISLFIWIHFMSFAVLSAENKPVLIGATVSLEGKYKEASFMIRNGIRLWEKEINQRGGLLGRPVKLILYDDKSKKELVRHYYEKLITEDKVDLVFSPYSTSLTLVASEVSERHQFVMLASGASGEIIWERQYKYIFGVYSPAGRYFIGLMDLMARNGLESAAILYEKTSFNVYAAKGAQDWAKRFGLKVCYKKSYESGKAELPGLLKEVKDMGPDGIILCAYPADCFELLRLMKEAKYRPKVLGFTIAPALPDFYHRAGDMSEGVFGPSQWEPDERIPFPGTEKFISDFTAFSRKLPSYHAGSAYASCQILEKAINHSRSLNHDRIRDFILSLDTITVIGRFKVDHKGKQIGHNPIIIQWQDGKKEIVYPRKMQTASPRF